MLRASAVQATHAPCHRLARAGAEAALKVAERKSLSRGAPELSVGVQQP